MNNLKLEITSKALNDIEIISNYIAIDNRTASNKLIKELHNKFKILYRHPNLGKTRNDFTYLDVKFYIVKKNYLIVYRIINNNTLRILRILTTYQDICSML